MLCACHRLGSVRRCPTTSLPRLMVTSTGSSKSWPVLTRRWIFLGHDWGGGHVMGVAMTRPDLLRSWASDIVGAFEPDYVWHPAAQIWQTPGDGEQHIEELFSGTVADRGSTNARDGNSARSSRVRGGGPGRGHGSRDAFAISVVQATGTSRQPAAGYQRQLSDLDWS